MELLFSEPIVNTSDNRTVRMMTGDRQYQSCLIVPSECRERKTNNHGFPMKPKTLLMLETGLAVTAIALVFALHAFGAEDDTTKPQGTQPTPPEPAAAAVQETAPPAAGSAPADAAPVVPVLAPPPLKTTPGMKDIFELARSGVSEEVLGAFVEKSGRSYHPSVEEIIYLKDLGVAPAVIAKVIRSGNKDSDLARQVEAGNFDTLPAEKPAAAPPPVAESQEPPPQPDQEHYAVAPQPLESAATGEAPAPAADATVNLDYFKGALDAYGTWIDVPGYGTCWRPTIGIADVDWQPYYDGGRWIYTNCGWYWLSDYSWGWAPFHYGRWLRHTHWGWVWVPGYTWGPAWVEWRTTDAYCGWAPLPPYYGTGFGVSYWDGSWGLSIGWSYFNWVPYRYCYGYYPRHYAVHHDLRHSIYDNSSAIHPTVIGGNHRVIVTGPNATVVANAAHTEIRRINIRDVGSHDSRGPRDYLENGGRTLAAFRPTVSPDRVRPETELANRRAEFRRPSTIEPAGSAAALSAADAAATKDSRNIIVRGGGVNTGGYSSYSTWRTATERRTTDGAAAPRISGQNTTIVNHPEYRRPATESTPLLGEGRSVTLQRPAQISEPVVGGAITGESRRNSSYWNRNYSPSAGPQARQQVTIPDRTTVSPLLAEAPVNPPSRRTSFNANGVDARNFRNFESESRRLNQSPPNYYPSLVSPGASVPAAPARSYSPPSGPSFSQPSRPSYAPPSRPSYSPPAQSPSYSRPSTPQPSRSFSSPPSAPAPSRSYSAPAQSPGGGGGRSDAPARRQN
jgi:hypothetical protein